MSDAQNLTTNKLNGGFVQVYFRNQTNQITQLVSLSADGSEGANADVVLGAVGSQGRVLFATSASNITANDANGVSDVFMRDMKAGGATTLVSVNKTGSGPGNGISENPRLSYGERYIVFESEASDLVEGDTEGFRDIFVRDLFLGTTVRASVNMVGPGFEPGHSSHGSISLDGRYVSFLNMATKPLTGLGAPPVAVFVRDLWLNETYWVSKDLSYLIPFRPDPATAYEPIMSVDGRVLLFAGASALRTTRSETNGVLVRYDVERQRSTVIQSYIPVIGLSTGDTTFRYSMSRDGQRVAYHAFTGLSVWDAATSESNMIGVFPGPQLPQKPVISDLVLSEDGRYLVFSSTATNLTTNEVSGTVRQIFIKNLETGHTRLVSHTPDGKGVSSSGLSAISVGSLGSSVVFTSSDPDLVPGDRNQSEDVFFWNPRTDRVELVSAGLPEAASRTASSSSALEPHSVSANGQRILFASFATNVVSVPSLGVRDYYVRDLTTQSNILVTASLNRETGGNQSSSEGRMTPDGRFVVFSSIATNLVTRDRNEVSDVFVRDLERGVTLLASVAWDGTNSVTGISTVPSISADGRFVAFESTGSNLVHGFLSDSRGDHIYVRDLEQQKTVLVDASKDNPTRTGNRFSYNPEISPDGRYVVFRSLASDLIDGTNANGRTANWFVRDLSTHTTRPLFETPLIYNSVERDLTASFDGSGRKVAVTDNVHLSVTTNGISHIYRPVMGVVLHHLDTGENQVLCTNCQAPVLSGDGRFLAAETIPEAMPNEKSVIILMDLQTRSSTVISAGRGSYVNGDSSNATISADGRFVVYESRASNLGAVDLNEVTDVYLYNRAEGRTLLVSQRPGDGIAGNSLSLTPSISADGRIIAFQSHATDLISGDRNLSRDVFVARLAFTDELDSDGDGMDDAWEMAHFGTVERDGTGDFDGDGVSDWLEWKAGTSPNDPSSRLAINVGADSESGATAVWWSAIPGKRYLLQFTQSLGLTWDYAGEYVNTSGAAKIITSTIAGQEPIGFYRILLVE